MKLEAIIFFAGAAIATAWCFYCTALNRWPEGPTPPIAAVLHPDGPYGLSLLQTWPEEVAVCAPCPEGGYLLCWRLDFIPHMRRGALNEACERGYWVG